MLATLLHPLPAWPAQLTQSNPRNREGVRYATRTVLVLADFLRALGQHGEANLVLMKAHFQVRVWQGGTRHGAHGGMRQAYCAVRRPAAQQRV